MNDPNPYQSPMEVEDEPGVFLLGGHLVRKGLLHRRIQFNDPFDALFDYDGKYFRQRLMIDKHLVWYCISWTIIHRSFKFNWPAAVDPSQSPGRVEIKFKTGLNIRRFTVFRGDETIYDEVT